MDIIELQKVIGYLCWNYNDETQVWIIFLIEEAPSVDGGGCGKGVLCQLFRPWTSVHTIDLDKHFKNSEILQSWQGQFLVHINDLYGGFDLRRLKAFSSEGTIVKYLFKNLTQIAAENMPKIIISSQAGFDVFSDGGVRRRIFLIPFTSYFNPGWTPEDEYHGTIPGVWTAEDWSGYDSFIVQGIQEFMKTRRLNGMQSWNEFSWKKNFDHTYGAGESDLRIWLSVKIPDWACQEFQGRGIMNKELMVEYDKYCVEARIRFQLSITQLRKAIREYCNHYNIGVEMEKEVRENQYQRGRGIVFECVAQ